MFDCLVVLSNIQNVLQGRGCTDNCRKRPLTQKPQVKPDVSHGHSILTPTQLVLATEPVKSDASGWGGGVVRGEFQGNKLVGPGYDRKLMDSARSPEFEATALPQDDPGGLRQSDEDRVEHSRRFQTLVKFHS